MTITRRSFIKCSAANRRFVSSFLSHGWTRMLQRMRSNGQAFKHGLEFQPLRYHIRVFATPPCRGLSLSR
jgi:hypothetical protein